jgi:hypothetical protein
MKRDAVERDAVRRDAVRRVQPPRRFTPPLLKKEGSFLDSPPTGGCGGVFPSCLAQDRAFQARYTRGGTEGDGVVGGASMLRAVAHATRCSESGPGVAAEQPGGGRNLELKLEA